jgi:hypothetical protein
MCVRKILERKWSEDSMGASAHNDNAPKDIMDAVLVEIAQTSQN